MLTLQEFTTKLYNEIISRFYWATNDSITSRILYNFNVFIDIDLKLYHDLPLLKEIETDKILYNSDGLYGNVKYGGISTCQLSDRRSGPDSQLRRMGKTGKHFLEDDFCESKRQKTHMMENVIWNDEMTTHETFSEVPMTIQHKLKRVEPTKGIVTEVPIRKNIMKILRGKRTLANIIINCEGNIKKKAEKNGIFKAVPVFGRFDYEVVKCNLNLNKIKPFKEIINDQSMMWYDDNNSNFKNVDYKLTKKYFRFYERGTQVFLEGRGLRMLSEDMKMCSGFTKYKSKNKISSWFS